MQNLVWEWRSEGDAFVVELEGRLDAAASLEFREQLTNAIDDGRVCLVVELSGVDFIDSTGLSVLITALKTANAAGGDVALARPSHAVRSIIELTRLNQVFGVYEDVASALERLKAIAQN